MKTVFFSVIAFVAVMSLVAVPVGAQGVTSYDTNGDGTNDFTLRTHDTNGDGKIDKVHFDTDNDGVEDPGEHVVQCRELSVISGGGGGAGRTIILRCNTGTETTVDRWTVRDNNGDGDTSDAGETVAQPHP